MKKRNYTLTALCLLIFTLSFSATAIAETTTIKLYAGAGLRTGITQIIRAFEQETGIRVETDYAGSGVLISKVKGDPDGDLFMPGDEWYVDRLNEITGLIEIKKPVCFFVPTIITAKGNPKNIRELKDFMKPGLQLAVGNPKACQIGRLTKKLFKKNGHDITTVPSMKSLTVNELGVWVKMGNADCSIVWDAIAENIASDIEMVTIPKEQNIIGRVVVGLLRNSEKKDAALAFTDFLNSPRGQQILADNGYQTREP